MRFLSTLLLSSLLILAAGCSAPQDTSDLTPTPSATPGSYQPGSPVETRTDAITVASKLSEEPGGVQWIESPQTVFAEEMSYAKAVERLGVGEGEYDLWPPETRVWLVVFKGQWQLVPLDPSQASPQPLNYEGCAFVLFAARDGKWMAMGDAVCPSN
jgi:hypothetical protein